MVPLVLREHFRPASNIKASKIGSLILAGLAQPLLTAELPFDPVVAGLGGEHPDSRPNPHVRAGFSRT